MASVRLLTDARNQGESRPIQRTAADPLLPLGLLLFLVALCLHLYWALRFTRWAEWDTALTTWTINSVLQSGQLVPNVGVSYWSGYTYQVLSASLVYWTGWNLHFLQLAISPVLGLVPVGLLFLLYRELLSSSRLAILAGLIALLQADFLFTTSRGSHEKVDLTLLPVALLALTRVYTGSRRLVELVPWVLVFYLSAFALLSTNMFFAGSFLATLTVATTIAYVLERRRLWRPEQSFQPLVNTLLACVLIEFLIVFYLYPPMQKTLEIARDAFKQLGFIFFGPSERQGVNPYALAAQAWIFPYAWIVLRLSDVLTLGIAALGWWQVLRSNTRRSRPQYMLLLVLVPALAAQFIVGAIGDRAGSNGIWNTEVRIFPVLVLLSAPLSAYWLQGQWLNNGLGRLLRYATAGLLPLLLVATLVKATNEPLLSNTWTFHAEGERLALRWLDQKPSLWSQLGWPICAGIGSRLIDVYVLDYSSRTNHFMPVASENIWGTGCDLLIESPLVKLQEMRGGMGIPDLSRAQRLYDNGTTQVYDVRRPLGVGRDTVPESVELRAGHN